MEVYPRGPAVDGLALQWAPPGCTRVQLRMFEPPRCGSGHVEALPAPPAPTPPLQEVTVAYSNSSVMLCGGHSCTQPLRISLASDARMLVVQLAWEGGLLSQRISCVDGHGVRHASHDWVRSLPRPLDCPSLTPGQDSFLRGAGAALRPHAMLLHPYHSSSNVLLCCVAMQVLTSPGGVPDNADVLRVEHLPDAADQAAPAPAIANVTVQRSTFQFRNRGWDAAALALALGGAGTPSRHLAVEVMLDLGQLDETANVVKLLLEDQPAAHMTGCYSGEPLEVSSPAL